LEKHALTTTGDQWEKARTRDWDKGDRKSKKRRRAGDREKRVCRVFDLRSRVPRRPRSVLTFRGGGARKWMCASGDGRLPIRSTTSAGRHAWRQRQRAHKQKLPSALTRSSLSSSSLLLLSLSSLCLLLLFLLFLLLLVVLLLLLLLMVVVMVSGCGRGGRGRRRVAVRGRRVERAVRRRRHHGRRFAVSRGRGRVMEQVPGRVAVV